MTANAGYHAYATGDVLTAAQVQYNLQNQTVMYFATTTARDAALTGAILVEGMVSYTPSTGLMYYNGSAWTAVSGATIPTSYGFTAGKNSIINGAFNVWQRGTSFSSTLNTITYTADRWDYLTGATAGTFTLSRIASGLTGFQYAMRCQRTASSTQTANLNIAQALETATSLPLAGQTVTLSFYARAGANYSATSNVFQSIIIGGTGTDQNNFTGGSGFTGQTNLLISSATLTTSWQRFSYSVAVGSSYTQLAAYFAFAPTGTAGASDYYDITGVQLEISSTATSFQTATGTIQGELAACQRYYYRVTPNGQSYGYFANGQALGTTSAAFQIPLPVTMRTYASAVEYSNICVQQGNTFTAASAVTASYTTASCAGVVATVAAGLVLGQGYGISANNSTSAYLGFSAEL
jgi:hypothetical protein